MSIDILKADIDRFMISTDVGLWGEGKIEQP